MPQASPPGAQSLPKACSPKPVPLGDKTVCWAHILSLGMFQWDSVTQSLPIQCGHQAKCSFFLQH